MTGSLTKGERWTQLLTERFAHEGESTNWGDASTSGDVPEIASEPSEPRGEAPTDSSSQLTPPCQTSSFQNC